MQTSDALLVLLSAALEDCFCVEDLLCTIIYQLYSRF